MIWYVDIMPELGAVISLMAGWGRTSEMTGSMPCLRQAVVVSGL